MLHVFQLCESLIFNDIEHTVSGTHDIKMAELDKMSKRCITASLAMCMWFLSLCVFQILIQTPAFQWKLSRKAY